MTCVSAFEYMICWIRTRTFYMFKYFNYFVFHVSLVIGVNEIHGKFECRWSLIYIVYEMFAFNVGNKYNYFVLTFLSL